MSEQYTPTTEEVRTDYIMAYTERQSSQLLAGLAFDRWHAAEVRRAKAEAWRELVVRLAYFEGLDLNEHPNPYREESGA